ncbi:hypothetical protein ABBQ32_001321 [Trebouxia sp. C0010 RCD-2024]
MALNCNGKLLQQTRTFTSSPCFYRTASTVAGRRRSPLRLAPAAAQDQDRGPFDEGAAQVKKLLTRDKRELMGVEQIGQRARTEFDEEDSKPSTSGSDNGSTSKENTRLFGEGRDRSKPTSSPFGGSSQGAKRAANPFGPDSRSKPFIEPANLSPTMKAIPIDDTPWYKKITLGQVVCHLCRLQHV